MKTLAEITVDDIEKVYNGKPGCACGCRGRYVQNTPRNRWRIQKYLDHFKQHASDVKAFDERLDRWFSLDTDEKRMTIYLKGAK